MIAEAQRKEMHKHLDSVLDGLEDVCSDRQLEYGAATFEVKVENGKVTLRVKERELVKVIQK